MKKLGENCQKILSCGYSSYGVVSCGMVFVWYQGVSSGI